MGQILFRFSHIQNNSFGELTKLLKEEPKYKIHDFKEIYLNYTPVNEFAHAMESCIKLAVMQLCEKIVPKLCDQGMQTIADIGGGSGFTLMEFCRKDSRIKYAIDCELPELRSTFDEYIGREEKSQFGEGLRSKVVF